MTKRERLNTASDLKRIAYWLAVGDKTKIGLINRLWRGRLGSLKLPRGLKKVFESKEKRIFLAEELLNKGISLEHK